MPTEDVPIAEQNIYMSDLVTGVVASLGLKGREAISSDERRLSFAFEKTFEHLRQNAERYGVNPRFRVIRHYIHGTSEVVSEGILDAMQRGMLRTSVPSDGLMRLTIAVKEDPFLWIRHLPGDTQMYDELSRVFWESQHEYTNQ